VCRGDLRFRALLAFRAALGEANTRPTPVLRDELDAGRFERGADRREGSWVGLPLPGFEIGQCRDRDLCTLGNLFPSEPEHRPCTEALFSGYH